MITLEDFLQLAMDDFYKINIYSIEDNKELLQQVELNSIEEELQKISKEELLHQDIASWDIDENTKYFTINI